MTEYPYLSSNKNVQAVFEKVRTAAKPSKFTISFMKQLGFTSSNDQAYPSLFKRLGFITDDGTPTVYYDALRDGSTAKTILASRIKELYSELFTINTKIYEAPDDEIKGAISRLTGKDAKDVGRIFTTFKALCNNADFNIKSTSIPAIHNAKESPEENKKISNAVSSDSTTEKINTQSIRPDFHYNIQIHLPATTDISVYNAIFRSIKENLLS
ncbi:DUF5343 domain-containing protein [Paenibacillus marinisediminis]